ncbi:MAG TPA: YggT family protein [Alphaproteobacteria bacterium]|nr:YggT family protein [Alphaproteobacteria bacterium]
MYLGQILVWAIHLYLWIIVIHVAVSWLIAFKVLNMDNPQARNLVDLLKKATDPVMKPIQKYVPPIGGIDITPIIVIIGLQILSSLVWQMFITPPNY